MSGIAGLFEPEELVGGLWHRLVGEVGTEPHFPDAAVQLADLQRRLEIYFRGLGGQPGVAIKAIAPETVEYRKSWIARLGHAPTTVTRARFDGDTLFLPEQIEVVPERSLNESLYRWLTAWAAVSGNDIPQPREDPLRNDIATIRNAVDVSEQVLREYPGLAAMHGELKAALLDVRQERKLPDAEAAIEAVVRTWLGAQPDSALDLDIWRAVHDATDDLERFAAPKRYAGFMPLILWGEVSPRANENVRRSDPQEHDGSQSEETKDGRTRKARRQKSEQIERNDPMILARFEAILSWTEMMNINRAVDDDDEDNARKAADDQEELGIADISKKASTRLKFDLDLAPEDVEHERLADKYVYPEWDYRRSAYLKDHARVLAAKSAELPAGELWQPDRAARRRIRAVKRQFEALRPKRERFHRQIDGEEIDMDAFVRSTCELAANGEGTNRVFTSTRETARDLAVAVLIDTSRSSESWIEGRQVIEISKEALLALAAGLAAVGDDNAIFGFSSLRRDRVSVSTIKDFDEALGPAVYSRIGALRPGFYTRLGAAIRHVSTNLAMRPNARKLLLVLTDGKPNDLDHYEGRYGVEDTMMAVREVRRTGQAVFGITIDKKAQSYFPHIFGRNAYAIANHANSLTSALPLMYRHLLS